MSWVLVVDDDAAARRLIQLRLESEGYDVEVAPNGADALERLGERDYYALITDICMPRMSGQELVEILSKEVRGQALRIFVLSSRPEDDYRSWTRQHEGLTFLEKPISLNKLVALLAGAEQNASEAASRS